MKWGRERGRQEESSPSSPLVTLNHSWMSDPPRCHPPLLFCLEPTAIGFSLLCSQKIGLVMDSKGTVAAKWALTNYYPNRFLIELKIFSKLHLKCWPFFTYGAITWPSSASTVLLRLLWLFSLHAVLHHSVFSPNAVHAPSPPLHTLLAAASFTPTVACTAH